jgi:predicted 3-demethylubiquinone-9 3-methyltransferase (glyoxalase superfamily)
MAGDVHGRSKDKTENHPDALFVGKQYGKAEKGHLRNGIPHARVGDIDRYNKGEEPDKAGTIKHAAFVLEGQEFAAMDSARVHNFAFNEAISFMVHCETQEEIDCWGNLSADQRRNNAAVKNKYESRGKLFPQLWTDKTKTKRNWRE